LQVKTQAPVVQAPEITLEPAGAPLQLLLHVPQVFASVTDDSQPEEVFPSQSRNPLEHDPVKPQTPPVQERPAAGTFTTVLEQRTPQPPQLVGSLSVLSGQPLPRMSLQSVKPAAQTSEQTPASQVGVSTLGRPEQSLPQPPQLVGSAVVSTSQPRVTSPSQSAWVASHTTLQEPALQEA
jgi:hypothetical protein